MWKSTLTILKITKIIFQMKKIIYKIMNLNSIVIKNKIMNYTFKIKKNKLSCKN